jgi:hypothetical protein
MSAAPNPAVGRFGSRQPLRSIRSCLLVACCRSQARSSLPRQSGCASEQKAPRSRGLGAVPVRLSNGSPVPSALAHRNRRHGWIHPHGWSQNDDTTSMESGQGRTLHRDEADRSSPDRPDAACYRRTVDLFASRSYLGWHLPTGRAALWSSSDRSRMRTLRLGRFRRTVWHRRSSSSSDERRRLHGHHSIWNPDAEEAGRCCRSCAGDGLAETGGQGPGWWPIEMPFVALATRLSLEGP